MPDERRAFGGFGERAAARAVEARGVRVVAINVRTRFGELDLVGRDRDGYVFFEVKTRRAGAFVAAAEAVDRRKLARLERLAQAWLAARGAERSPWRVVVLAVTVGAGAARIDWIEPG